MLGGGRGFVFQLKIQGDFVSLTVRVDAPAVRIARLVAPALRSPLAACDVVRGADLLDPGILKRHHLGHRAALLPCLYAPKNEYRPRKYFQRGQRQTHQRVSIVIHQDDVFLQHCPSANSNDWLFSRKVLYAKCQKTQPKASSTHTHTHTHTHTFDVILPTVLRLHSTRCTPAAAPWDFRAVVGRSQCGGASKPVSPCCDMKFWCLIPQYPQQIC